MPDIDVLVLGGAGVDTIVYVPELPLPFADSYMIRPGIETRAGQSGDFVALGVRELGLRTHHLDMVGDDREGDLVRALHRERAIPSQRSRCLGAPSALSTWSDPMGDGCPCMTTAAHETPTGCPR